MTGHFGERVIGKKQYEKEKKVLESGSQHFGPRVIGPGNLETEPGPKESVHGPAVNDPRTLAVKQALVEKLGKGVPLEDLDAAELEYLAGEYGVKLPSGISHKKAVARVEAAIAKAGGAPEAPPETPSAVDASEGHELLSMAIDPDMKEEVAALEDLDVLTRALAIEAGKPDGGRKGAKDVLEARIAELKLADSEEGEGEESDEEASESEE